MKLRIASGVLWFLAGWAVTGTIACGLGLSQAIGPLVGIAWAALVAMDPMDVVWRVGKRSGQANADVRSQSADVRKQVGVR
jgi:hypothetical protein